MNTNPRTLDTEKTINDDFELRDLAAGVTLCGKYCLELEAGKGGMGVVWKAWDAIGERWVALKFLPPGIRHSESAMAQVKSAFHTVQALNHPNICPVYGLEKDPAFGYFVVKKWLEGQPLNALQLPREEILSVLEKVAEALDYAHSEKVIHRDVKPSNIFIGTDGKVTLIDFGIAANLHSENQATQGQFASSGTEKYMAPEQRSGQLQTAQTDEYALALVAMELFAGSLSPLAFRKVAPEIQDVLETALADKPTDRFVTCREFVKALSAAVRCEIPKTLYRAECEKTESEYNEKETSIEFKIVTFFLQKLLVYNIFSFLSAFFGLFMIVWGYDDLVGGEVGGERHIVRGVVKIITFILLIICGLLVREFCEKAVEKLKQNEKEIVKRFWSLFKFLFVALVGIIGYLLYLISFVDLEAVISFVFLAFMVVNINEPNWESV